MAGDAEVFTLMVVVGRSPADELPHRTTGAELLCYAAGRDEGEAVRATVKVLRAAALRPFDVAGYGSLAEREAEGTVSEGERGLIERARRENAVIIANLSPLHSGCGGTA